MLKSKRITVTVPGEFLPLIEDRKTTEHLATDSKYFLSLLLFDLMTRAPHKITAELVNEPEHSFYNAVRLIVENYDATAPRRLSPWLRHRLEEVLEETRQLNKATNNAQASP